MSDEELIDAMARLWVDKGGDATGMVYCWTRIIDRIKEIDEDMNGDKDEV